MKPALGVMKLHEFSDSTFYRISCQCGEPDHELTVELAVDDFCMSLHLYGKLENSIYWGSLNWFQRQWKRIKGSIKYLFCGYIECEQEFIFTEIEHIQSFIDALREGKEKYEIKTFKTEK